MANTEVILTESIESVGADGDIVKVSRGYARNFLFPHGKALELTAASLHQLNYLKANRAKREARELETARELGDRISKLTLSFELEIGEEGKVFGSITARNIADRILSEVQSITLPRHTISLEKPIKEVGYHEVQVKLHPQVIVQLSIFVQDIKGAKSAKPAASSLEKGAKG